MGLLDRISLKLPTLTKSAPATPTTGPADTTGLARFKALQKDAFAVEFAIAKEGKKDWLDMSWRKDPRIVEAQDRVKVARSELTPADLRREREQTAFAFRNFATKPNGNDDPALAKARAETLKLLDQGLLPAGVGRHIEIATGNVVGPNKDVPPAGLGGMLGGGWSK